MQLRTMLGGLLAAGLMTVGCGGAVENEVGPEQSLSEAEQGLVPTCPAGYTRSQYWDCAQVCGAGWGNFLVYYCSNGTHTYEAGTGAVRCGACY